MPDPQYTDEGLPRAEIGSGDAPFIYVNMVSVNIGPFDVTMDFGYQAPEARRKAAAEGQPAEYERVVRIAMSHGHAKSMIPILAGVIAKLEEEVGRIPTPGFEEKEKE